MLPARKFLSGLFLALIITGLAGLVFHYSSSISHAQVTYVFDLNNDGVNDTNLAIINCTGNSSTCLSVNSSITAVKEIKMADTTYTCPGAAAISGPKIKLIGDFDGDGSSEVSALFCENDYTPKIKVVSVLRQSILGSGTAPTGQTVVYVDFVHDPTGKLHPFIAESYGPGNWGYLCVYRPDLPSSPECGTSFAKAPFSALGIITTEMVWRQVGGFTQDLDGDGWDDINLMYEWHTIVISPRTLGVIHQMKFDVAKATETHPYPVDHFHGGRQYGTHSAVTSGGKLQDVMVGGTQIGSFGDAMCNVSRFVAVLESDPGNPASRVLKWSKYFGFHSGYIDATTVYRAPDVENGCIQRFSDSRSKLAGTDVIIFNHFIQTAPISLCLNEQLQGGTAWTTCLTNNLKSRGHWAVQVLRESDGTLVTDIPNNYLWGWATDVYPGAEPIYFVETLPSDMAFDFTGQPVPTISARRLLANGTWQTIGQFPVPGRPFIPTIAPEGPRGLGDYSSYSEFNKQDLDGDGLQDILLTDGRRVGWSRSTNTFVIKTATPTIVTVGSVTPSNGSGFAQVFNVQVSDNKGSNDIGNILFLVSNNGSNGSGQNACYVKYDRIKNELYLINDAGNTWSTPLVSGVSGSVENAQCILDGPQSKVVSASGNTLSLNLDISFKPGFVGLKDIYVQADSPASGVNSGWQAKGNYTVTPSPAFILFDIQPKVIISDTTAGRTLNFSLSATIDTQTFRNYCGSTDTTFVWSVWERIPFGFDIPIQPRTIKNFDASQTSSVNDLSFTTTVPSDLNNAVRSFYSLVECDSLINSDVTESKDVLVQQNIIITWTGMTPGTTSGSQIMSSGQILPFQTPGTYTLTINFPMALTFRGAAGGGGGGGAMSTGGVAGGGSGGGGGATTTGTSVSLIPGVNYTLVIGAGGSGGNGGVNNAVDGGSSTLSNPSGVLVSLGGGKKGAPEALGGIGGPFITGDNGLTGGIGGSTFRPGGSFAAQSAGASVANGAGGGGSGGHWNSNDDVNGGMSGGSGSVAGGGGGGPGVNGVNSSGGGGNSFIGLDSEGLFRVGGGGGGGGGGAKFGFNGEAVSGYGGGGGGGGAWPEAPQSGKTGGNGVGIFYAPIVLPTPTPTPRPTPTPTLNPTPTPGPDTIPPVVSGFDVQPRTSTGSVNVSWLVTDTGGSLLNRVELRRSVYSAINCNIATRSGCNWINFMTITAPNANSWSSSTIATVTPGTYLYGINVVDGAGNRGTEKLSIIATVTVDSTTPTPMPSSSATPRPTPTPTPSSTFVPTSTGG